MKSEEERWNFRNNGCVINISLDYKPINFNFFLTRNREWEYKKIEYTKGLGLLSHAQTELTNSFY